MPSKKTPDWIEEIVYKIVDAMADPQEMEEIIRYYTRPAKTDEGKEIIERLITERALREAGEQLAMQWENELAQYPEYYQYFRPAHRRVWEKLPQLLAEGYTPSEIAAILGLSESTVYNALWLARKVGFPYRWRR